MHVWRMRSFLWIGVVMLTASLALAACDRTRPSVWPTPLPSPTVTPTPTVDWLVPTVQTPSQTPSSEVISTLVSPTVAISPSIVITSAAALPVDGEPMDLRSRLGLCVPRDVERFYFDRALAQQLGVGWYLDWRTDPQPIRAGAMEYAQMIRVRGPRYFPDRAKIIDALAANPGSLWLIGNEPDVPWQDNTLPADYAARYHELYVLIKTLDPSAQVAIGGISQVTPLRLQYVEAVLAAYQALIGQPMPVDVWNIHAFVLREERDTWGVSIPPGFSQIDQGMLWEIQDHNRLDLFQQQIVDFRRWMARNGQRDKPLIITEYGILMPADYGFTPDTVVQYMRATFDYLLNARDETIGYPADDNRLVQKLAWFSLTNTTYPSGNVIDPTTGQLTVVGQAFAEYAARLAAGP